MLSFFPMNSFCAIEDHLFPVPIRVRFPVTKSSTVVLLNIFLCHWGPYNPVSTQQVQIFWFWSNYGKYIVPMLILSSCWICNEAVAQVNQIFLGSIYVWDSHRRSAQHAHHGTGLFLPQGQHLMGPMPGRIHPLRVAPITILKFYTVQARRMHMDENTTFRYIMCLLDTTLE